MGAVFVSYRRGDSEGQARALSLELAKLLGKDSVFMDVDNIGLGRDFRGVLLERLGSCNVMLALIGPGWLDAKDGSGNRRLESPTDFVRQEVAAALKRNIPVIPVLLQGARMPPPEQLPDDIQDLAYRNGFELGHSTWESDVRELVRRLGLSEQKATPSAAAPTRVEALPQVVPPVATARASWPRPRLLATVALAVIVGAVALFVYLSSTKQESGQPVAQVTPLPQSSTQTAAPSAGTAAATPSRLPDASASGGLAVSGVEFVWPGGDCWDIFRKDELVTYKCGTNSQVLEAGTYTLKGKWAPVFVPFEVVVKAGSPTRIGMGGILAFEWPGDDCWDIFRGDQLVTHKCGTNQQALQAGTYTIKGKWAQVVVPFQVDVKDGSSTRVKLGGVFTFTWPGEDCWDIFRGEELVTHKCGTNKQALQGGTYTIKGKWAPVFKPFEIKVVDGGQTKAP